jgi:hypothetical protein
MLWTSVLAVVMPAHADGAADLKRGIEAYDLGEYERAEPLLRSGARSAPTARERATAWMYLGMSQMMRGNAGEAGQSFARAGAEDASVAPDRERTPPSILRVWDVVRPRVASPKAPSVATKPPAAPTTPVSPKTFVRKKDSLLAPTAQPTPWYKKRRTWGWVTLGIAGASALGGIVFGRSANSAEEQVRMEARAGGLTVERFESLAADISSNARLSNIFFGIAGAAVVTGVVLVLLGEKEAPARRGVRVLPTLGGAAVSVRF